MTAGRGKFRIGFFVFFPVLALKAFILSLGRNKTLWRLKNGQKTKKNGQSMVEWRKKRAERKKRKEMKKQKKMAARKGAKKGGKKKKILN